jgi:basic membrane protein A
VALLAPGTKNNKSWANAWWNGAQRAADDLGLTVEFVGPLDNPDQYLQQGTAFASQGFDLVIMANGAMHDPAVQVATQFPDVQVCQAPYHPADESELQDVPENVCFVDAEQQDSTFLAGMLAGLVTKTNRVASVNGFAFPALTRQPEAFSLGARCVNDGVEFAQRYINSWDDPALAKAAASSLIAGGADVILGATDQAVLGIYEAAREADSQVWVIPSYFDDYESAPEVVLTSALHGLQEVSRRLITSAARGEIEPRSFTDFNVENTPSIDIAPLYANEQKVGQAALDDFQRYVEQTRSGEIEIPDETVGATPIGTEGAAEKIDPASLNCEPVK